MDEERSPLVVDNGSFFMKAGFAGDDAPRAVFPPVVGRRRHPGPMVGGMFNKELWFGDEAVYKRGPPLSLFHPIQRGIVTNWDDMELLWYHMFESELRAPSEEQPVMHTETTFNSKADREQTTQIMFETFNVPAFYLANHAALAMYASGRTNGVAVMSGHQLTETVPIVAGHAVKTAAQKMEIGGQEMSDHLLQMLTVRGYTFSTTGEKETLRDIKEKLTYTAVDYDEELKLMQAQKKQSGHDQLCKHPSGSMIRISGEERIHCAEPMFNTDMLTAESAVHVHKNGRQNLGVMVLRSVARCSLELRKDLLQNIVLSGGNTMFVGFEDRLQAEVQRTVQRKHLVDAYLRGCSAMSRQQVYNDIVNVAYDFCDVDETCRKYAGFDQVKVSAPLDRKYNVWIGGSILASMSSFETEWIPKGEYEELGPAIVHRKCF